LAFACATSSRIDFAGTLGLTTRICGDENTAATGANAFAGS
jgi:hypothetical protein